MAPAVPSLDEGSRVSAYSDFSVVNSYKERVSPMRRRKIESRVTQCDHAFTIHKRNELCTPSIIARTEMNGNECFSLAVSNETR